MKLKKEVAPCTTSFFEILAEAINLVVEMGFAVVAEVVVATFYWRH